ncbi:MAG: hypothetical protein LQ350_002026 [Teloschistes chrysophthalmus]|nr:MAG: hypothetical protein LQ350_002026 [Niorma chrysophthalma]
MADDNEEISEDHDAQPDTTQLTKADRGSAARALPQASSTLPPAPLDPSPSGPEISAKTGRLGSQPMTTTSSASSTIPSQARNAMDDQGPSPYGTRSRNRAGNARPNYAEDRELDMDYESAPASYKTRGSSTSASSANLQGDENEGSAVNTRRRSLTTAAPLTATKGSNSAAPKDPLPGMSSFSVHPESSAVAQQPSKKRKAPGAVPTTSTPAASNHGPTANHSTLRKGAAVPPVSCSRTTNMLTFETSKGFLKNEELIADDGTVLAVNDHVYLICEPPGEPYYLARIMEFLHTRNDHSLPIDALRVNWYYRPRDIQRKVNDTRVVFASMHSDTCPLTSLRGKCQIRNRHDIGNLDDYRKIKDNFWYEKMFDRYIHRYYEVIPTNQVINVPARVKKVLDERWRFVIVEQGRGKELTSAIKTCKRCAGYSASNDSVDCAICKNTYHMSCVQPPLSKKPARGFAWACGPCSRKQERKLEARNIPTAQETPHEDEEEEVFDDEEEEHNGHINTNGADTESLAGVPRPATAEQSAQARLWPYRYLGIHCRVEDALDYDDRIYPRASSRLGPKHQANVTAWHGRPVELVKPAEIKRRYMKKKDGKLGKETVTAIEEDKSSKEKRPKWVMDEPQGYIHRGEDLPNDNPKNTARVQFRMPEVGEVSTRGFGHWNSDPLDPDQREQVIDEYMSHAKANAPYLGMEEYSTNFLDKALELLYREKFDVQRALTALSSIQKRSQLGEPELTKEELKRFEEGVAKYGSELRNVSRYVGKSRKHGEIVRFYYMWKKTPRGKQIWGNYEGRKGKKQQAKQVDARLVDDVADDVDDSAFDNFKASHRKRRFECKFCAVRKSPQWRRAPNTAPGTTVPSEPSTKNSKDKTDHLVVALCQRCAGLWRKYGIQWEDIDEVAKKVANSGGRAWRRKQDEEFLVELINANEMSSIGVSSTAAAAAASVGVEVPPSLTIQPGQDLSKKRQKVENQTAQTVANGTHVEPPKKKPVEKPLEPLIPEPPVVKTLPCAVCYEMDPMGDQRLVCRHCRLTVHRSCYGIASARPMNNWSCDTCFNDTTPQVSTSYECVLCPVTHNEQDLLEPPKVSHKKKTDREREKERLERDMVIQATEQYRRRQDDNGRPRSPREPFKRTSGNCWVHITCALWHPEIKFSDATSLEASEGFQSIPAAKYEQVCKLCKTNGGACVSCHQCAANFHVACAIQYGYRLGFDVTPVKGSRKDVVSTVTMGSETGNVTAVVYCREHTVKSIVHPISEAIEDSSFNALQLFAKTYKQADLSLTGTVRKAAMMNSATRSLNQATVTGHRGSISAPAPISRSSRVSPAAATVKSEEFDEDGDRVVHLSDAVVEEPKKKVCSSCSRETSPKWHKIEKQTSIATKVDTQEADEAPPVPVDGMVNGASNHSQEAAQSQEAAVMEDITLGANGNVRSRDPSPAQANGHEGSANTFEGDGSLDAALDIQEAPTYLCHKCHLMKHRNPPSPAVTDNGMGESQLENQPVNIGTPSPPPPPPPPPMWPIPPPAAGHDPYSGWSGHPHPHFQGPPRIPNGIPPSPPSIPPPLSQHFPPPPEQYHHAGFRPQPSYHDMPVQHPMNGVAGPYHVHRTSVGHLATGPYPSHHPPPPQAHHAAPPRDVMSPRMQQPPMNGPHGPPRAEENPFAVPYSNQLSPRQDHQHIYGGPHGSGERPETPPGAIGRGGLWVGGDGPLSNGASASPSLRNLLH